MDPRELLLNLEKAFQGPQTYNAPADQIVQIGLSTPTDYWVILAMNWLEQGAPSNADIKARLNEIASDMHYSQSVRHKARQLSK
jgi:hypothetical protein